MTVQEKPFSKIKGLRPIPVLGAKAGLFRFFGDPINCLTTLYRDYGLLGSITDGDTSLVCAFGADYNQQLLSDQRLFNNWAELPVKLPPDSAPVHLNNGLTAMNDDLHRRHRRLLMPAFSKTAIDSYHDDVVAVAENHLNSWEGKVDFDLLSEIRGLALAVATRCLFGLDIGSEAHVLGEQAEQLLTYFTSLGVMMFPFNVPGAPYRGFLQLSDKLEARFLKMIHERRQLKEQKRDVLSILIGAHDEDGSSLTDAELMGHTNVLFVAGHETTAFTLAWTLFLLAQHPRIFGALVDELDAHLYGNAPTSAQIPELGLLDRVIKESMRLLPATPFMFLRESTAAFNLGDYQFPKGSQVILSPLITHRIPTVFERPNQFNPDRWLTIKPSAFEYLPFGAGPRMCIGSGFASMAIRVLLPMIVQRFRLSLQANTEVSYKVQGITFGPKFSHPLQITRQDRRWEKALPTFGKIHDLVDLPHI